MTTPTQNNPALAPVPAPVPVPAAAAAAPIVPPFDIFDVNSEVGIVSLAMTLFQDIMSRPTLYDRIFELAAEYNGFFPLPSLSTLSPDMFQAAILYSCVAMQMTYEHYCQVVEADRKSVV